MDAESACRTFQYVAWPVFATVQSGIGSVADALPDWLAIAKSQMHVEGIGLEYCGSGVSFRVSITAVLYTAFWQAIRNQPSRVSQVTLGHVQGPASTPKLVARQDFHPQTTAPPLRRKHRDHLLLHCHARLHAVADPGRIRRSGRE